VKVDAGDLFVGVVLELIAGDFCQGSWWDTVLESCWAAWGARWGRGVM